MKFQLMLAARYLWGRKLRTTLTTLAIVMGVMVMFGMGTVLPTMVESFQRSLLSAAGEVDVTVTHKTGEAFSANIVDRVKAIGGVSAVAGSIYRPMNIPETFYGRNSGVTNLTLNGIDPVTAPSLRDYTPTEGRFLKQGDTNAALIRSSLAKTLGLKLGGEIRLPMPDGVVRLAIVGILQGRPSLGNEDVYVTLSEAQKLLDMSGRVTGVEANLNTKDAAQRDAITQQIQAQLGKNYVLNSLSTTSGIMASLQTASVAFTMIGVLTLFMGGFIIFNTFRTVVAERRHDFGMLRAIGASRGTIVRLILVEGMVQGIVGTAIGLLLGYGMALIIISAMQGFYRSFLNGHMGSPVISPGLLAISVLLGLGVTVVAGLLPAVSAGRVTPIEVLRPAPAETMARVNRVATIAGLVMVIIAMVSLLSGTFALVAFGGILFLAGLVLLGPALVRPIAGVFSRVIAMIFAREGTGELAQGNITRQPSRSAVTASATMIGLAIVVGAGGLMWSLNDSMLGMFRRTLGSDFMLIPPSVALWKSDVGASSTLVDKLRSVPGVGTVSTMRFAQSSIAGSSLRGGSDVETSVLGIDPTTYQEVSGMDFQRGDPAQAYTALASGRSIIVNGILAAQTGINPGDTITLSTPEGQIDYKVSAVAGDLLDAKVLTAYISQDNMRADFNKAEDIFIQINLAQGADVNAVQQRLQTIAGSYPQFRFVATREYLGEFSQQFDAIFAGVYVMLAILSLPSLIAILNTLAIGVIERTREIGMLRAIGAARRQVRRMIVAEALLLAAIGTAFGLLGGLYLSYVMVQGLGASGIFKMQYSFPIASVLAAIAAGLIFGVLASLFPARQAARMEIIRALRYE